MTLIIALFGLLLAAACVWGILVPKRMSDTIFSLWEKPSGLWLAIGARVVLGILFILAAPETRFPVFFHVFGYLMLIAAALIPIVGKERLTRLIRWFMDAPPIAIRLWLVFGLVFALFIVYAAI